MNWGNKIGIRKHDGGSFDLNSLDLDANDQAASATITGYDPSGFAMSRLVNFDHNAEGRASVNLKLDWLHLSRVEIRWHEKRDGAGGDRFGAISNLVLNHKAN
jgi:hypothetical protein